MPSAAEHFQDVWNATHGKTFGRKIAVPTYKVSPTTNRARERSVSRGIATGTVDINTDVENAYQDRFGDAAVGGGSVSAGNEYAQQQIDMLGRRAQRRMDRGFREKIKAIENEILESGRIDQAVQQQRQAKIQDAFDKPSNPMEWIGDKIGKGISLAVSRPQQALLTGINEMVQQPGGGKEPGWSDFTPQDMPGGFWAGLTGQKHTSGGEMMEELFPSAPHVAKIAGGATIDLGADPTNWVGLGLAKQATRTGRLLKEASMAEEGAFAVTRALAKSGVSTGKRSVASITKELSDNALERTQRLILDIKGGGVKGRINVGAKSDFASSHAFGAATDYRNAVQGQFESMVETFKAHVDSINNGGPKLISDTKMKQWKKAEPDFKTFHDALPKTIKKADWETEIQNAADKVRRGLDKDVETFQEAVMREVEQSYRHTLAVRVGGKQIKVPAIGAALEVVSKQAGKIGVDAAAMRKLSHAGQFPGKLALLQQRGRSFGTQRLEALKDEFAEEAVKYTKAERKEIIHAIEGNLTLPHNAKLQGGVDFVKKHLKRMWDEELDFGARNSADTPYLDNYTYVWNRKGNERALRQWKFNRKGKIKETGGASAGDFQIHNAITDGHRPVEDAFDMLIRRQMKSNRDITRALFTNDLVENYGQVVRGLDKASIDRQGLRAIPHNKLAVPVRARASKDLGDSWYLPKEMANVLDDFEDFSKFTTDPAVMKYFRKVTNFFKAGATVYNPGYHTRNMISDTIMGMMDGIGLKPYYELLSPTKTSFKRMRDANGNLIEKIPRFHPRTGAKVKIGPGWTMTMDELWALFRNNASGGGYFGADFGAPQIMRGASKVNEGVRRASELREDFGRVAHFLGALRQEYKGGTAGYRNIAAAQDKALEQAVYRVNHYKFDYGALTKWEQKWVKPAVPFYTFTRKAFPAVVENFAQNPKWIHRYQMMRESPDGDPAKNFSTYALPPWMRDVGYATVQDEKEPWLMTYEGLPTNVFSNVIPTDKSVTGFSRNILENINPIPQTLIEQAFKEEVFSGRKTPGMGEYILNKFGGPLSAGAKAQESYTRGMTPLQLGLTSRLGLGLPLHKVSEGQQEFQKKLWEDVNIEGTANAPFDKFNAEEGEERGIHIYTSKSKATGMSSYKVRDDKTGQQLYQGTDPFEALKFAKSQSGTTSLPTSLDDWNSTVGAASNLKVYWSDRKKGSSYRVRNTKNNNVLRDFKDVGSAYEFANQRAGG